MRWRSVLFTPAGRPDFVAKLPRAGADLVVIDLEDSVPTGGKDAARAELTGLVALLDGIERECVLVRVNAVPSPWFENDIAVVAALPVGGVVVPKVEDPAHIDAVRSAVPADCVVLAGLETAMGVHRAIEVLRAGVSAAYFGAEDYVSDVGGVRTSEGHEVLYARSHVALAARLAGVPAIDQVVTAYRDAAAFRADASTGRSIGYSGKLCVHPDQVALAHECFSVSDAQRAWARRVLEGAIGRGAFSIDGQMIDEPMIRRARAWLAHGEVGSTPSGANRDRRGETEP